MNINEEKINFWSSVSRTGRNDSPLGLHNVPNTQRSEIFPSFKFHKLLAKWGYGIRIFLPKKATQANTCISNRNPQAQFSYLGSRSFSFLDFSDVIDALDLMSSDRFIFLGWASMFPARNSLNVRCTSCIHKNAYSRNVARKLCNKSSHVCYCHR